MLGKSFFRSYYLSFFLLFEFTQCVFFNEIPSTHTCLTLACFVRNSVVQFSRIDARPRGFPRGQLDYYSTTFFVCQEVFQKFFRFFSNFFFTTGP